MNLIVFDIDGTIVDSVKTDDECFIQSFRDLFSIDLSGADWSNFKNVTDSGLSSEIFEIHMNRQPFGSEIIELKDHFYKLLYSRRTEITQIDGAINTLKILIEHQDISVAFATGGWKETAELKLSTIGFEIGESVLTSANQSQSRAEITKLAIEEALVKERLNAFDSITYIGDGLWDFQSTEGLGINFIGVDYQQNNKLIEAGAQKVVPDLSNTEQIILWTKSKNNK